MSKTNLFNIHKKGKRRNGDDEMCVLMLYRIIVLTTKMNKNLRRKNAFVPKKRRIICQLIIRMTLKWGLPHG